MRNNAMRPNTARNITVAQKRKESQVSSFQDFAPDTFVVSGKFLVDGPGEVLVPVNFPVSFEGEPTFSFGASMDDNNPITQGSFPTVSAIVATWDFNEFPLKQLRVYKGASLAAVITGTSGQKVWLHWQFIGKAFVNPVDNFVGTTVESTI